jgi:hypothetical protein
MSADIKIVAGQTVALTQHELAALESTAKGCQAPRKGVLLPEHLSPLILRAAWVPTSV